MAACPGGWRWQAAVGMRRAVIPLVGLTLVSLALAACVAPLPPVASGEGDVAGGEAAPTQEAAQDGAEAGASEVASLLPTVTPSPLPTVTPTAVERALAQSWGAAPEIQSDTWLNSPPLQLADLRGQVVLVEFWTFDCINCRNVLPAMQEWEQRYGDDGLVIIGIHTPEFAYEREVTLVQDAVARLGVTWPVALDNEKVNWRAYRNRFWPVMYLIDKEGEIRYIHIGEGKYDLTAAVIEELLHES